MALVLLSQVISRKVAVQKLGEKATVATVA